jgi:DNA polymerase III epsilon subunit family exonuclease
MGDRTEPAAEMRLKDAVYCALDFETTGINPVADGIVEIGLIRFTLGEVLETYSTFVNPGRDMPEAVIKIHGITGDMVKGAPPIADLLDSLAGFIGDSPLVIQNPRFDLSFMEVAFKQSTRDVPAFRAYDTVTIARQTFANLPNYRLQTLCESLGVEIRYHRALSDALGCMEVFRRAVAFHDHEGSWTFNDLHRIHGQPIRPRLSRREKERLHLNNRIVIGDEVQIRYMDETGKITNRRILPKGLVQNGGRSYLWAFCYLRNGDRYFNTRRILKVF